MTASAAETFLRSYDTRQMPRYTFGQVARYLHTAESTIRSWFLGMPYGTMPHIRHFRPILEPASRELLSFFDAASAHVLLAFKANSIPTEDIRAIVQSLKEECPGIRYPLLGRNFFLFGRQVIVKEAGERLNLTQRRQLGFRHVLDKFLRRLELDKDKMPIRFSPIINLKKRARAFIVIDPNLSGGRPVIKGTGIAAEIVAERKKSGESVASLAKDYRISRRGIEEAISYFAYKKAA
jgi:uncharacterized protein (DUF433 family)